MKYLLPLLLLVACKPSVPEPSSPTPQPVATIAASPTPAPRVAGSSDGRVETVCTANGVSVFRPALSRAINLYQSEHLADFRDAQGNQTSCILNPSKWNDYYFGVVDNLNKFEGVDAIVDDCGGSGICGEIAIKVHGTKKGEGFSEQHHILKSNPPCIRLEGERFKAKCIPAWFNK